MNTTIKLLSAVFAICICLAAASDPTAVDFESADWERRHVKNLPTVGGLPNWNGFVNPVTTRLTMFVSGASCGNGILVYPTVDSPISKSAGIAPLQVHCTVNSNLLAKEGANLFGNCHFYIATNIVIATNYTGTIRFGTNTFTVSDLLKLK